MGRAFWIVLNWAILILYGLAVYFIGPGEHALHPSVLIAALFLIAHVLEIPLAMFVLRGMNASKLKTIFGTLLFGFTWWIPAKQGLYSV